MKMPDYFTNKKEWWKSYTDIELNEMLSKRIVGYTEKIGECWLWTRGKDVDGYGAITFMMKNLRTHREMYRIHKGKIPIGMFVCHTCDNTSCCNPEHLFLGRPADNTADMIKKKRHLKNRGQFHHKSKVTEKDVIKIRKLLELGVTGARIAKDYNLSRSSVCSIKKRKSWKHVK